VVRHSRRESVGVLLLRIVALGDGGGKIFVIGNGGI